MKTTESYLFPHHYDLVTPDGYIVDLKSVDKKRKLAIVRIESIFSGFVGFEIEPELVFFNLKSTLAQIGIEGVEKSIQLDRKQKVAVVEVELTAYGDLAAAMLELFPIGAFIGKLFAADERRRVRDTDYLLRMSNRSDRRGRPLLSLGGLEGSGDLILEKNEGRTVAFLSLKDGILSYEPTVYGFLPTLAKALHKNLTHTRQLLHLHHQWIEGAPRIVRPNEILLVRTAPLHIRTVYARVVDSLLPQGYHHASARVLQPDTTASGDIYELYGTSHQIINDIPLEFYTLEPHREHVFFSDRDQLIASLENPEAVFDAFGTAPEPIASPASVFVVKGTQMKALTEKDWILREP
ncbi:MAG: hypothetical protein FJZ64_03360, partial [Chlamydiae bacterium]|nr:hypothetical protein [Chlamydiota bacterium]